MATEKAIQELKECWESDPTWDIEDSEGFEEHWDELLKYRLEKEDQWEREWQEQLRVYAGVIGLSTNLQLAKHIYDLTERIKELEKKCCS